MKKRIIILVACILGVSALVSGGYFLLKYQAKQEQIQAKEEQKNAYKKYGTVERETVEAIFKKVNTLLGEARVNMDYVIDDGTMTLDKEQYWYLAYHDIYLRFFPVKMTKDPTKDIVSVSSVWYQKESNQEELAKSYARFLLKANLDSMTEEESNKLLENAKEKAGKQVNSGKGISVIFIEEEDYYEYQVIRLYKEK